MQNNLKKTSTTHSCPNPTALLQCRRCCKVTSPSTWYTHPHSPSHSLAVAQFPENPKGLKWGLATIKCIFASARTILRSPRVAFLSFLFRTLTGLEIHHPTESRTWPSIANVGTIQLRSVRCGVRSGFSLVLCARCQNRVEVVTSPPAGERV